MKKVLLCLGCNGSLEHKRIDAKTCSGKCRCKIWRVNKEKSVLVSFRMPIVLHTDLFLAAHACNQGVNAYLNNVVSDHLTNNYSQGT